MNYKRGKAKSSVIRIHPETKTDLNFLRVELKMPKGHNEGDVIERLIKIHRSHIVYYKVYEEALEQSRKWKARCDYLCNKHGIEQKEIMKVR